MKNLFSKHFLFIYLCALASWGAAYVFFMPPFEGRQEYFQYSSVRQFAHTGSIPVIGEARVDEELVRYGTVGPVPYRNVPPFDPLAARTYSSFSRDSVAQGQYQYVIRDGHLPRSTFSPSSELNVAAQHSVFYYSLLYPFSQISKLWPLYSEVVVLRLASLCLALLGVFFAYLACKNYFGEENLAKVNLAFVIYPLLFPQFFVEFSRIGNDALALLFFGLLLFFLSREKDLPTVRHPWKIGFAIGMGVLAKAVFIPVILALLVWLLISNYRINRTQPPILHANFHQIKKIFYGIMIFGGWWYVERWLYFGYPSLSWDVIRLGATDGFWTELSKHFTWPELLSALYGTFTSWHWMGGGSMVDLPFISMLPILGLSAFILISAIRYIFKQPFRSIDWFFIFLAISLAGFLMYHALLSMALYKTTYWRKYGVYFQDFMPATVWLLSGLLCFYERTIKRWYLISGLVILGVFQIFAIWSMWALYAGCAIKGVDREIIFTDHFLCLSSFNQVWQINSVLTNMSVALMYLLMGLCLFTVLAWRVIQGFDSHADFEYKNQK